ncbi:MAG: hypothetical protein ACM3PC_12810 [Deltaproteobacteria bacterium]
MFSRRLHPTPSGFAFGLAVIALWALIWIWFFAQLSRPHPAGGHVAVAVHAHVSSDGSGSAPRA